MGPPPTVDGLLTGCEATEGACLVGRVEEDDDDFAVLVVVAAFENMEGIPEEEEEEEDVLVAGVEDVVVVWRFILTGFFVDKVEANRLGTLEFDDFGFQTFFLGVVRSLVRVMISIQYLLLTVNVLESTQ